MLLEINRLHKERKSSLVRHRLAMKSYFYNSDVVDHTSVGIILRMDVYGLGVSDQATTGHLQVDLAGNYAEDRGR